MFVVLVLTLAAVTSALPITSTPVPVDDAVNVGSNITKAEASSSTLSPAVAEHSHEKYHLPEYKVTDGEDETGAFRIESLPVHVLDTSLSSDDPPVEEDHPVITNLSPKEIQRLFPSNDENRNEISFDANPSSIPVLDFVLKDDKFTTKADNQDQKSVFKLAAGDRRKDFRKRPKSNEDFENPSKDISKISSFDPSHSLFRGKNPQFPFAFEDTPIASKWSPYLDDAFYPLSAFPEA